ncbi:hypothetical protein P389DRAFT_211337 [Cystobasidium minutum MCA 4210]|uniref:uncharacterized protein n=1 Tax=Cystobasidium minutum MCA 4210 TaxID=1397322 RepID=UPI0034CF8E05|eukprot:jgi/Rhomi1/211337/estExt_Genemark1.C_4_t30003
MRRFLGANLHINTSSSSSSPTSPVNGSTGENTGNLSSTTKRAFQQTFGQLSRGTSSTNGKNSINNINGHGSGLQSPPVHHVIASSISPSNAIPPSSPSSPIPPTPPSKHGHSLADNEEEEYDDSSWDDALKLPFGSSIISRASSSASSAANPYEGVIERTGSTTSSRTSSRRSEHDENTIDALDGDDEEDGYGLSSSSRAGQRTSTATISASRTNNNNHNNNLASAMLSAALSPTSSTNGASASSNSMLFSNTQQSNATTAYSMDSAVSNNKNTRGLQVSAAYAANASSLVDLKDEMMLELLSSDALIHVAQFEILGFDEVEELRKEHSILSNRLQSLQAKLQVETKIRDAALSISKLYATKRLSQRQKQAAEEELRNADKKVEFLNNEFNKLSKKEIEIKSRILRHMAAVLALSFRKMEANYTGTPLTGIAPTAFDGARSANSSTRNGFQPLTSSTTAGDGTAPSSAASSRTGPYTPLSPTFPPGSLSKAPSPERQGFLSPNALYSPTFSTGSSSTRDVGRNKAVQAFEGPHFFANNKDAIIPGSLSRSSTSASAAAANARSAANTPSVRSPSFSNLALFTSSSASSTHSHTPSIPKSPAIYDMPLRSPALSTNSTTLGYMDISGLEAQLADATAQLNQFQSHAAELQNTIDVLKAEKMDLTRRIEELANKGTCENVALNRQYQDSQLEIQRLKSDLKKAQARIEENIKDAGLWEDQSRKLHDDFENERSNWANRLKDTLHHHARSERSAIGKYMPPPDQVQNLDMARFAGQDLGDMLASMEEAHARALDENARLQDQLSMHQQSSQQANNKNADEARFHKRQVEQLQQEKQVLMKKITRIEAENLEIRTSLKELTDEHDSVTARHAALQERFDISSSQQLESERRMAQKIQEVDKVHTERMHEKEKALNMLDQDKKSIRARMENLQNELQEVRNEKAAFVQNLLETWKNMPSDAAIQARLNLKDTDDVVKFKAVYLSTASSPKIDDSSSFTPDKLAKRVQGILESDGKIISRLAAHEDHAASHKAASIRAEKLLQESKVSLQAYSVQVRELEERISKTDEKEVQMLERLNDLSSALETARAATKRAEANVANLEKKCSAAEKDKDNLNKKIVNLEKEKEKLANKQEHKLKIANLEKEVADLKDELASAQDELDELRTRESKQRVQLLDELTQLTEEASSLRAQLRTAQRKLAAAGR